MPASRRDFSALTKTPNSEAGVSGDFASLIISGWPASNLPVAASM